MNTVLWQMRQWGRRLGAGGLLGLALLVLALGCFLSWYGRFTSSRKHTSSSSINYALLRKRSLPSDSGTPDPISMLPPIVRRRLRWANWSNSRVPTVLNSHAASTALPQSMALP